MAENTQILLASTLFLNQYETHTGRYRKKVIGDMMSFKKHILKYFFLGTLGAYYVDALSICPQLGSSLIASGISRTETGCTITTSSIYGVNANLAANINLSSSSVTTSGSPSFAVYAQNSSSIMLNNLAIATSGGAGDGLHADTSSQVSMNTGTINVTGFSAYGAAALGSGAVVNIDNVTIQASGSASNGLYAYSSGGVINAYNSNITISGNTGSGVFAQDPGSTINLDNTTVTTNRTPSGFGARALNQAILNITNGSSINTLQSNSPGLFLDQNSSASVSNSSFETFGNFSFGNYVQGGSALNLNDVSILTHGTNAYGILAAGTAFGGTSTIIDNSTVHTEGVNAYTILSTASSASLTNTLTATDSQFISDQSGVIYADSGNTNINFSNVLGEAGPFQNIIYAIPPTQDFIFVNDNANLNFSATNNSILYGNTIVSPLGNAILAFNQGTSYTGAIQGTLSNTNLTIDPTSTWVLTGNSTLSNLTSAGHINYTFDPNSFKTMTVNNLIGQGGTISLNTFLQGDGSPSDLIIVNGGNISGNTSLIINNTFGLGEITTGDGILVVEAVNGGTTNTNAFSLGFPAIAGPFEYQLFRSNTDKTLPNHWYLRSFVNPVPDPQDDPSNSESTLLPISSAQHSTIPYIRREISLYPLLPPLASIYSRKLIDTLHQRVGEEEFLDSREGAKFNGVWARMLGNKNKKNGHSQGIYGNFPKFENDFSAAQIGYDLFTRRKANGSRDHIGFYTAFGHSSTDVQHNLLTRTIKAGNDSFNAYSLAGYWTHFGSNNKYLDAVLQGTYYEGRILPNRLPLIQRLFEIDPRGRGIAASLEGGYPFHLRSHWQIEPQAQLIYQTLNFKSFTDIAKTHVRFKDQNSLAGRLGAKLSRDWTRGTEENIKSNNIWVRADLWREFIEKPKTEISSARGNYIPFIMNLKGNWWELVVGSNLQLTRVLTLYGSVEYQSNFNRNIHGYGARVGLRCNL